MHDTHYLYTTEAVQSCRPQGPQRVHTMKISIVATTPFAIIAVVALVAMAGAVTTGAAYLLNAALTIVALLIVGSIVIVIVLIRFR